MMQKKSSAGKGGRYGWSFQETPGMISLFF